PVVETKRSTAPTPRGTHRRTTNKLAANFGASVRYQEPECMGPPAPFLGVQRIGAGRSRSKGEKDAAAENEARPRRLHVDPPRRSRPAFEVALGSSGVN